jgi:hypothetical protein
MVKCETRKEGGKRTVEEEEEEGRRRVHVGRVGFEFRTEENEARRHLCTCPRSNCSSS